MDRVGPFDRTSFAPTYGQGAFDQWTNGNRSTGQKGSFPPHEAWSHPNEEIVHVIEQAGLTPDEANLTQLHAAIAALIDAARVRLGNVDFQVDGWQTSPPASPQERDRYIVKPTATGAWAGHDQKIAHYLGGTWTFSAAVPGLQVQYWSGRQIVLRFDGSAWAEDLAGEAAAGRVALQTVRSIGLGREQIFTVSGTFTVPADVIRLKVRMVGGGGGGGCGGGGLGYNGAGGGGGGYTEAYVEVTPGATYSVVVGAAGAGGVVGGATNGGTGGTSSFGSGPICQATGGMGGRGEAPAAGGTGGAGSGGYINIGGGFGQDGPTNQVGDIPGGGGGASIFGGGGRAGRDFGQTALAYGAGGGGGWGRNSRNGGAGGPGLVIVEY